MRLLANFSTVTPMRENEQDRIDRIVGQLTTIIAILGGVRKAESGLPKRTWSDLSIVLSRASTDCRVAVEAATIDGDR